MPGSSSSSSVSGSRSAVGAGSAPAAAISATVLGELAGRAQRSDRFGSVRTVGGVLECDAAASASLATYMVGIESGKVYVSLVMADRYLSQSIEQDLVHTGDKMSDLLKDELIDLGVDVPPVPVEHFRSPEKLFTFRAVVPVEAGQLAEPRADEQVLGMVLNFLLGFEACFGPLGDMSADGEE